MFPLERVPAVSERAFLLFEITYTTPRASTDPLCKGNTFPLRPAGYKSSVFTFTLHCRGTAHLRAACASNLVSHLGARELEHDDLASMVSRDEDLVAVHTNCKDTTLQIDVNALEDVA